MSCKPTTRRRRRAVESIIGRSDLASAADIQSNVILSDATNPQIHQTNSRRPEEFNTPSWLSVVWTSCKIVGTFGGIIGVLLIFNWFAHEIVYSGDIKFDRVKAMEVQVNGVRRKFEDAISLVKKEFDERMDKKWDEANMKLRAIKGRIDVFEKFMDRLDTRGFLSKEEFGDIYEDFIKERDYTLASGGGKVLRHWEPYGSVDCEVRLVNRNRVSAEAEKTIRPSLLEPGQCFTFTGEKVCGDQAEGPLYQKL